MINENISIDECIKFLNDLIKLDMQAILDLCQNRVSCNEKLADHPTVQVDAKEGKHWIGLIGILNGLFGIDDKSGMGPIGAVLDDPEEGKQRWKILTRFTRTSAK